MSETRERALAFVVRNRHGLRLYSNTGKPTKEMRLEEGDGWKVLVNMSQPCAGEGQRGVIVRKLDGEEVCERFSWIELAEANWSAIAVTEVGHA